MNAEEGLIDGVRSGSQRAIARLISRCERAHGSFDPEIAALYRHPAHAHVVGITGPPGAGKSTLVASLTRQLRRSGLGVGILAVDPTSPYSGGALLGDRIRMTKLAEDPDVYVRSMATRGRLGGLAPAVADAIRVLALSGREVVIVETVGVGQDEVEIAKTAHTTVVVSVPGLGDHVQAMKAGLLEVGDIHVVNKSDLPGADQVVANLRDMLRYDVADQEGSWRVPVIPVAADHDTGVPDLAEQILEHQRWLTDSEELAKREHEFTEQRVRAALVDLVIGRVDQIPNGGLRHVVADVLDLKSDPFSAATALLDDVTSGNGWRPDNA